MIKIMAPAGDKERMIAAIKAGADELYMGIAGFGARRFAQNFSVEEYCSAIDLAHQYGVSVHLTLNTILSDREMDDLYNDLSRLYQAGLDAVIVQDFGVVRFLRSNFPGLPLHASTQMSISHPEEIEWLGEQGFKRAVLARELSLDEIENMRAAAQGKMELEIFASGSLCLSCSGKCYLSSFIGGRSGNRGMCTQPCRQYYKRLSPEPQREGFFLSLKDQLQDEKDLEKLAKIGVDSIKLEGRMKSPVYVYEIVRYFRALLDKIQIPKGTESPIRRAIKGEILPNEKADRNRIVSLFNRGYDKGYLYDHDPDIVNEKFSANFGFEIGKVRGKTILLSRPVCNGDGIVYLDYDMQKLGGKNVDWIDLIHSSGNRKKVDSAKAGDQVVFDDPPPERAVYVYKTNDFLLNKEISNLLLQVQRYSPVNARLSARLGKPLKLTLQNDRESITVESDSPVEKAKKIAMNPDSLRDAFDRFGESPYWLNDCKIEMDPDIFIPKSALNKLRQEATEALQRKTGESYRRSKPEPPKRASSSVKSSCPDTKADPAEDSLMKYLACAVRTPEQFQACMKFGISKIYYLAHPVFFSGQSGEKAEDQEKKPDGDLSDQLPDLLAGSLYDAITFEKRGKSFTADWTFNVGNAESVQYLNERFTHLETLYLSPELSENALAEIIDKIKGNKKVRPIRFGLPLYGYLAGMYTRKTLFSDREVVLENPTGHKIIAVNNRKWYQDGKSLSGSTILDEDPLDIIDAIPWIRKTGFDEIRLDFTRESAAEILSILKRTTSGHFESYKIHSYGFGKGIF
ncbi:MAG: U32 family peptidase [Planctomycetia bacterium]|nr:U32 family peptidase [Planctomycetia bacterium]